MIPDIIQPLILMVVFIIGVFAVPIWRYILKPGFSAIGEMLYWNFLQEKVEESIRYAKPTILVWREDHDKGRVSKAVDIEVIVIHLMTKLNSLEKKTGSQVTEWPWPEEEET